MRSSLESDVGNPIRRTGLESLRQNLTAYVAVVWGFCAYFPIGVMYLNVLLMLTALAISPGLGMAFERLRQQPVVLPLVLFLLWTLVAAAAGDWYPDTSTRIFHTLRVALVLCMGMMLTGNQAVRAFAGFACGSAVAAFLVALHNTWGLPEWSLWNSLLANRNNFSSGNMITMATASGACFALAIHPARDRASRVVLLALAVALGTTVALHAVSRNAQLLLAGLLLVALIYRFRSIKAVVGGLASVALMVMATWTLSPTTSQRFGMLADEMHAVVSAHNYSSSVGVRWRMYEEAVQGMVDHPVLGTGVGYWLPHWVSVWRELGPSQPPELRSAFSDINNPHNDFLLTGMETGVPGLILMAWWLGSLVRSGWRRNSAAGAISTIFGMSVVATAMVNAPLRDAALGMTLLWLLGASVALTDGRADA